VVDRGESTHDGTSGGEPTQRRTFGWYAAFVVILVVAILAIYFLTGRDALGATARFVWNGVVFAFNGILRVVGSLAGVIARGLGFRQISRVSAVVAGIGLGYAGSALLGDKGVRRAQGWRATLRAAIVYLRELWRVMPLWAKLVTVFVLIASQVYLHSLLIVFPIAFLVPVVRRLWVQAADIALGGWYWQNFGRLHRRIVSRLRRLPLVRGMIGALRVARIRYLCAWRLWRYDPRYRKGLGKRQLSLIEPMRLWRRGELDRYVGRPLLAGRAKAEPERQALTG
jgi:hypothetical protein